MALAAGVVGVGVEGVASEEERASGDAAGVGIPLLAFQLNNSCCASAPSVPLTDWSTSRAFAQQVSE